MPAIEKNALLALPKLELHIHLEGTFDLDLISQLAQKSNTSLPRPRESLLQFSTLAEFLSLLDWICALVRDGEDAKTLAYRYAQYARSQGVIYSEVIINPSHWKNISLEQLLPSVLAGFEAAQAEGLPDCRLLVSLRREQSTESARDTIDWVLAHPHPKLLGISVDGDEALSADSNRRFAPLLQKAKQAGLGITVHAGESSGPEGVMEALELLGAQRIDHGVRASEDPSVLETLWTKRIPLNVCYTSNLIGGVYTAEQHPLGNLYQAGQIVTVSTDDPMLLDLPLLKELDITAQCYQWSMADLIRLQQNAISAAFCGEEEKRTLRNCLEDFAKKSQN